MNNLAGKGYICPDGNNKASCAPHLCYFLAVHTIIRIIRDDRYNTRL